MRRATAVRMELNAQCLDVVGAVSASCEVGQVELDPKLLWAPRHASRPTECSRNHSLATFL